MKIKILHVASFSGNPGDIINHYGFYSLLDEFLYQKYDITKLEIRKTYQNYTGKDAWSFNEEFVEYANKFDYVFIGGGANFELYLDNSPTGSTISLTPKIIEKLKSNYIFYAQGFKVYNSTNDELINRFGNFLNNILCKDNINISVRNDGSLESIIKLYGKSFKKKVKRICDNGLFCPIYEDSTNWLTSLPFNNYIILSLAEQMWYDRFENKSKEYVIKKIVKAIDKLLNEKKSIGLILIPHIFSDFGMIYELLLKMSEKNRRSGRIAVAPHCPNENSTLTLLNIYNNALLTITGRFHGAIASLSRLIPTSDYGGLPKVSYLLKEILGNDSLYFLTGKSSEDIYTTISKLLTIKNEKNWNLNLSNKINSEKIKVIKYLQDIIK